MEAEALFDQRGELHLRDVAHGDVHDLLGPVGVFDEAQLLEQVAIVGIVVDDRERGEVVESFHQEAFLVEVRKAEGAFDLGAAARLAPSRYGVGEQADHFEVVDEIDPAEADHFLFPALVGVMVDDTRYAAHDFTVAIGEVKYSFAEFKRRILVAQRIVFV